MTVPGSALSCQAGPNLLHTCYHCFHPLLLFLSASVLLRQWFTQGEQFRKHKMAGRVPLASRDHALNVYRQLLSLSKRLPSGQQRDDAVQNVRESFRANAGVTDPSKASRERVVGVDALSMLCTVQLHSKSGWSLRINPLQSLRGAVGHLSIHQLHLVHLRAAAQKCTATSQLHVQHAWCH